MVRTLADGGSKKAIASKAPRKSLGCGSGSSSNVYNASPSSNNPNFGLVNHARMWPTPSWQKGINNFFKKCEKTVEDEENTSTTDASDSCERMDTGDVVITSVSCAGSSSGDRGCCSSNHNHVCSDDEEDKENIDPSSSPERLAPKLNGRQSEGSDSASPSPKQRKKATGKQKAPVKSKKKKRMVLQVDSDYDD